MWGWIIRAAIYVGAIIYNELTKPKVKKQKPDKDTSNLPRASEGDGISVVFGYAYIKDPLIVYYKLEPLISFHAQYLYFCTFQEVICLSGIDGIEYLYRNSVPNRSNWNSNTATPVYSPWTANASVRCGSSYAALPNNKLNFDDPLMVINASDEPGGMRPRYDDFDLEFGAMDQVANTFLSQADHQSTLATSNRGVVQAVRKSQLIGGGNSVPSPLPYQYLVKRILKQHDGTAQWYSAKAHTGYGLNAIHVIRELIISNAIGAGLSSDYIDSVSFEAAADTCYTEGAGLDFHFNNPEYSVRQLIDDIKDYIGASLYFDMSVLKFKIKLLRNDYNFATLDLIDEESIFSISDVATSDDNSQVINDCTVFYTDRFTFEKKSVNYCDDVSVQKVGKNSVEIDRKWLFNPDYANRIAMQAVLLSTSRLLSCSVTGCMALDKYFPGDVFKLSFNRLGWSSIVFRVVEKRRSDTDSESITLSLIEDLYGIGGGAFGFGDTETTYPDLIDVLYPSIVELPYFLNRKLYGEIDPSQEDVINRIHVYSGDPSGYTGYRLLTKLHADTDYDTESSGNRFIAVFPLSVELGMTGSEVSVSEMPDHSTTPNGGISYIVIDSEIMFVYSVGTGKCYVYRGMHDTLPAIHLVNAPVYFFRISGANNYYRVLSSLFAINSAYDAKLASESPSGTQDPDDAEVNAITVLGRSARPYCMGNVLINGYTFETDGVLWIGEGDLTYITWAHRNRLTQYDQSVSQTRNDITSEAGVVYYVEIWDALGTTLKRAVIKTGLNYDYNGSKESTDFGGKIDEKIIKLSSLRPKSNAPVTTFANTDATSYIDAGTPAIGSATIVWKGQDLTSAVKLGYRVTLAGCGSAGTFEVIDVSLSGSDSHIVVLGTLVDETLSALTETLSVPNYWESWQKWNITVKRLTAPEIEYFIIGGSPQRQGAGFSSDDYTADGFFYEVTQATDPAEPTEPADPTTASAFVTEYATFSPYSSTEKYWVKACALKNGQLSYIASVKNY